MKTPVLILLGALVAVQFAVLVGMINGKERILREGERVLFRTQPIDPHDPFQGRYVRLRFADDYVPLDPGETTGLNRRDTVYVTFATDTNSFVRFNGWRTAPPTSGAYLKTRYLGEHRNWNTGTRTSTADGFRVEIPFDRFYMDEAKAPLAEQAVRDATRGTNCWAAVRILNGKAVIEDVFVRGQSVRTLKRR